MKWYSVRKYVPPMQTICLIFTECNYYYVGRLLDNEDPSIWVIDHECEEHGSYNEKIAGVTHFCIPDPIEIEE